MACVQGGKHFLQHVRLPLPFFLKGLSLVIRVLLNEI